MRDLPLVLDIVLSLLVVLGAAFALVGAWGLVKFRDFLKRLHGPTKASTVGVGAVLLARLGHPGLLVLFAVLAVIGVLAGYRVLRALQ